MRNVAFALAQAIAVSAVFGGLLAGPRSATAAPATYPNPEGLSKRIAAYRKQTWHWQHVMGVPPTPTAQTKRRGTGTTYRRWVLRLWRHRAEQTRRLALNPPHRGEWLCIHRYEGSWRDSGSPYYGGLQMDISFQRSYGDYLLTRKGTANHWTPLEQMWVAERAYKSGRGFYAWPNTARSCGLI